VLAPSCWFISGLLADYRASAAAAAAASCLHP
jgi:hypothetical protein